MGYLEDTYQQQLVTNLLWCRNYHLRLAKEIEKQLKELSKKHQLSIRLE
jgi:hypothetical protein